MLFNVNLYPNFDSYLNSIWHGNLVLPRAYKDNKIPFIDSFGERLVKLKRIQSNMNSFHMQTS